MHSTWNRKLVCCYVMLHNVLSKILKYYDILIKFNHFVFPLVSSYRSQDMAKERKEDMALKMTSNPQKTEEPAPQPET